MSYIFLVVGLVSLGGLGILYKVADHFKCRPSVVNVLLFLWATLMSLGVLVVKIGPRKSLSVPIRVVVVGVICGLFSSISVLALQHALRYGKISTSWLVINLSCAIPTLLSIVVYREEVGVRRGLSLLLIVVSLFFLWWDRKKSESARQGIEELYSEATHDRDGG